MKYAGVQNWEVIVKNTLFYCYNKDCLDDSSSRVDFSRTNQQLCLTFTHTSTHNTKEQTHNPCTHRQTRRRQQSRIKSHCSNSTVSLSLWVLIIQTTQGASEESIKDPTNTHTHTLQEGCTGSEHSIRTMSWTYLDHICAQKTNGFRGNLVFHW